MKSLKDTNHFYNSHLLFAVYEIKGLDGYAFCSCLAKVKSKKMAIYIKDFYERINQDDDHYFQIKIIEPTSHWTWIDVEKIYDGIEKVEKGAA